MAKGPPIPHTLHKGDRESVGYLMAQEKATKDAQDTADTNATDLTALAARVTTLENPANNTFTSSDQTIAQNSTLTIPHGLSATPMKLFAFLVAVNANNGYSVGDPVSVSTSWTLETPAAGGVVNIMGCTCIPDATNITVLFAGGTSGTVRFLGPHKTTYALSNFLDSDWKLRVIASL